MADVPDHRHPRLDGDGWVVCEQGHRHWGRYGAAGLLLRARRPGDGEAVVLLQRRAWWVHHGSTWGVPGGARASHETPEQAALRETVEEVAVDLATLAVARVHVDEHGGWSYATVIAEVHAPVRARAANQETATMRWVALGEVEDLELHPGFAATWPALLPELSG